MNNTALSIFSLISIVTLAVVYYFLITEKMSKVVTAMLGASFLVLMQVFRSASHTSQEVAFEFISRNLDVLGFVIGMMILVGIVRGSGIFEVLAIGLAKAVGGNIYGLLIGFGFLTLFMTSILSNIPTVLILTPVLLILIKELKLPFFPFFFIMVSMANIGGAMTPISDPTTYYQSKVVGLSFLEVISNSGVIVLVLSVMTLVYTLVVFRTEIARAKVSRSDVELFDPLSALRDRKILIIGVPVLVLTILVMVLKEPIFSLTGITIDNATVTLGASFMLILFFHEQPKKIFQELVDWEIIFFFIGLFIIVGGLEFTNVIAKLAQALIHVTGGDGNLLLGIITMGIALISVFVDNVPLNITMVGAIQEMSRAGLYVYPLWWALNLGTSLGGAGSPIAAACNVIAFGQAEKEKYHVPFKTYLAKGIPLVVVNGLVTFGILLLRYGLK